jgi:zinc D-Ala-D-Ala dipeptidase
MNSLPKGFVRYNFTDISIQISLRYAGKHNFVGDVVDGYLTNQVLILTKAAANQLFAVQNDVLSDGYSLVVYDAYRPVKAVKDFVTWAQNLNATQTKYIYYPYVDKQDIIPDGFVANKSAHSRGSTIDLTLIELGERFSENPILSHRQLNDGRKVPYYNDSTIDMGSSFDLFDNVSLYTNQQINATQYEMRMYLQDKMIQYGFMPYLEEWWHFTLKNEPFPNTYFDFDIV